MRVFRCRICGGSHVGTRRPSHCPLCGSHEKFMVLASEWSAPVLGEFDEDTKKNLERALEMELAKAAFYACAAGEAGEGLGYALFDTLSRFHGRHALTIRSLLGLAGLSTSLQGTCEETIEANLSEACARQERAVDFYRVASGKAGESRVKEVLQALSEVEGDQLTLLQRLLADYRK